MEDDAAEVVKARINELEQVLTGIVYVGELTPKSRDTVISFGERLSAPIVSGALKDIGVSSQHLTGGEAGIVTDNNFGEAGLLMNFTKFQLKKNLEPLLKKGAVPVITGFIAATQDGETTTLGRGGSDYTATIVGAALEADEVWIWTDVDGLMTSDPKIVPEAKTIPEISFQEATELTIFGAKAMHPRALGASPKRGNTRQNQKRFQPRQAGNPDSSRWANQNKRWSESRNPSQECCGDNGQRSRNGGRAREQQQKFSSCLEEKTSTS